MVQGLGIGVLIGLGFGWLIWRLPVHLRTRHVRKLRKTVLDVRRIKAGFLSRRVIPNQRELRLQRVPWRDRIMEEWQVWYAEWKVSGQPRTPEQAAKEATEKALMGVT